MYSYKDKTKNINTLSNYMLAKTIPMFEWENLPDTIPYRELEKMLQMKGHAFITKHNDKLYIFNGGLGGLPDVYGNPTEIVVANPALGLNKTFNLEKDGVLINNDDMGLGVLALYDKYNSMIVENEINLTLYGFSNRMQILLSASDDKTKESAENYVKKIIDGDISVIGENAIFDGVKVHNASSGSSNGLKSLIEYSQYLKASMFNEIGLSANTNLKRERLVSAEVEQGEDALFPFVFSMLKCRNNAVERINEMFDTEIKVGFGSVWNLKHISMVDDVVEEKVIIDEVETTEPVEVTAIEGVASGVVEDNHNNVDEVPEPEIINPVEEHEETVEETIEETTEEKEVSNASNSI